MFPDLMLKKRAAVMNNRNKDVVIVAAFVQLQIMGCRGETSTSREWVWNLIER